MATRHPVDPATAISVTGLRRSFGAKPALAGVDLVVRTGEIYGFLGPNGAGKTTLTRILCTLLRPTGGSALVAGHDVVRDPAAVRLRIGAALQEAALDDKQTGAEMLRLQARFYGLSRRESDLRLAELGELIDLGDALEDRVATYSGGMKRRLDLALALVHNPQILFLDEPTTGLDPVSRARVWDEVRSLSRDLGVTVFLTTQYLQEADALAGRVGIIDEGRIVAEGTPAQLKRSVGTDLVVATVSGDHHDAAAAVTAVRHVDRVDVHGDALVAAVADGTTAIGPIAVALAQAGVRVQDLSLRAATLDDVFFSVTGHRIANGGGLVADNDTKGPRP